MRLGRDTDKVAYLTPALMKGLTAEASISLGEGAPRLSNYDGSINYAAGPLTLGFGYESANASKQFAVRAAYAMGNALRGARIQSHDDATLGKRLIWRVAGMHTLGASEFHASRSARPASSTSWRTPTRASSCWPTTTT